MTDSLPGETPPNAAALRANAEACVRSGQLDAAEQLLRRCLERQPDFALARKDYAILLRRQQKPADAIEQLDILIAADPGNDEYRAMKASALSAIGEYGPSAAGYDEVLQRRPDNAYLHTFRAHALRAAGRRDEAIAAYRKSIALRPQHGDAYWSLANLKTYRFSPDEIAAMHAQLAQPDLADPDRVPMMFALARALEDGDAYDEAFQTYTKANALWRNRIGPYADGALVTRSKALFTPEFLRERTGWGNPAPDPIFVVGMPRSGSTLVEQILSSHSAVEGTAELVEILVLADRLARTATYPQTLATLDRNALAALGDEYLARTRIRRKTAKPFFIDKMPNNFLHIGLIQLILPNAKIVDVRRHPLTCCVSNFKQHFASGQNFAYGLEDLGRYYREYVELMAHYDAVLPGKVHRVLYESLVGNPETEIRNLLAYCGLPFEDSCLKFHDSGRAIPTPSSEQVRQPIFKEGLESWRPYEQWLGPLKKTLGPVLDAYPAIPKF